MNAEEREFLRAAVRARPAATGPCLSEERLLAFYADRLDGDGAESVREHLAECPRCLELARDARQFLRAMGETGGEEKAAAATASEVEPVRRESWWQALLRPFGRPALGFATALAALLLLAVSSWLAVKTWRLQDQIARLDAARTPPSELQQQLDEARARNAELAAELQRAQGRRAELERELAALKTPAAPSPAPPAVTPKSSLPPVVASLVLLPGVRDPGEANRLSLPPDAATVRLQARLENDSHRSYRAVLRTADGAEVWRQSGLKARPVGGGRAVSLSVPSRLLSKRDYVLSLSGLGARGEPEEVERYSFRVVRTAGGER
jgi:cell division protein FtsB